MESRKKQLLGINKVKGTIKNSKKKKNNKIKNRRKKRKRKIRNRNNNRIMIKVELSLQE